MIFTTEEGEYESRLVKIRKEEEQNKEQDEEQEEIGYQIKKTAIKLSTGGMIPVADKSVCFFGDTIVMTGKLQLLNGGKIVIEFGPLETI